MTFARSLARTKLMRAIIRYTNAKVAESWRGGQPPAHMDEITREVEEATRELDYVLIQEFGPGTSMADFERSAT